MSTPMPPSAPITPAAFAASLPAGTDLWVFAYGSLMWDPGFEYADRRLALLRGYHRSFCIYSHRHRGTPERPGLVFGLDHGGACRGVAYRVAAARVAGALDYLWGREMSGAVYKPRLLPVLLEGADRVPACCFVVDRTHSQYCRGLDLEGAAALIRQGVGGRGANIDYLANTVAHLDEMGIADHGLSVLLRAVREGSG